MSVIKMCVLIITNLLLSLLVKECSYKFISKLKSRARRRSIVSLRLVRENYRCFADIKQALISLWACRIHERVVQCLQRVTTSYSDKHGQTDEQTDRAVIGQNIGGRPFPFPTFPSSPLFFLSILSLSPPLPPFP